jgi:hypothetical protein
MYVITTLGVGVDEYILWLSVTQKKPERERKLLEQCFYVSIVQTRNLTLPTQNM